jgi:hypothetical protein
MGREFPEAITWASPGVRERARLQRIDLHFKRDLEADARTRWKIDLICGKGRRFKRRSYVSERSPMNRIFPTAAIALALSSYTNASSSSVAFG